MNRIRSPIIRIPADRRESGRPLCTGRTSQTGGRHVRRRRGALVTETVIAALVLGVIASVLVPALRSMAQVRAGTTFETLALIELNNVRERLLVSGGPVETQDVEPGAWFRQRYPRSELTVSPVEAPAAIPDDRLRPVRLTLSRDVADGPEGSAVALVVWIPGRTEEVP